MVQKLVINRHLRTSQKIKVTKGISILSNHVKNRIQHTFQENDSIHICMSLGESCPLKLQRHKIFNFLT